METIRIITKAEDSFQDMIDELSYGLAVKQTKWKR